LKRQTRTETCLFWRASPNKHKHKNKTKINYRYRISYPKIPHINTTFKRKTKTKTYSIQHRFITYCKCIPILLYGLEPFDLSISQVRSLDFVIKRFFTKLFKTTSVEIVRLCQTYLCFQLPCVLLKNRTEQFRKTYTEYHYTCYNTYLRKLVIFWQFSVAIVHCCVFCYFFPTLWWIKLNIA